MALLGGFAGPGYGMPHYLARRSPGVLVQLSRLPHLTAAASDGRRDHEATVCVVSACFVARRLRSFEALVQRLRELPTESPTATSESPSRPRA